MSLCIVWPLICCSQFQRYKTALCMLFLCPASQHTRLKALCKVSGRERGSFRKAGAVNPDTRKAFSYLCIVQSCLFKALADGPGAFVRSQNAFPRLSQAACNVPQLVHSQVTAQSVPSPDH